MMHSSNLKQSLNPWLTYRILPVSTKPIPIQLAVLMNTSIGISLWSSSSGRSSTEEASSSSDPNLLQLKNFPSLITLMAVDRHLLVDILVSPKQEFSSSIIDLNWSRLVLLRCFSDSLRAFDTRTLGGFVVRSMLGVRMGGPKPAPSRLLIIYP